MFAQGEDRLFGQERVAVVARARDRDFAELLLLFLADQQLRRRNARQFVKERLPILQLG